MNHHLLLILHLFAAAIWVGGHTYLTLRLLPTVLKQKDSGTLLAFEKRYEPLGMSALLVLVITGITMATQYGINISELLSFKGPIGKVVSLKLWLLFGTIAFALSAQLWVIPSLARSSEKLSLMAVHVIGVTLLGILMMILGTFIRYGGL